MEDKIGKLKYGDYLPKRCLIHHGICPEVLEFKPRSFFVGFPFKPQYAKDLKENIDYVARQLNLEPLYPVETQKKGVILCKVCREIQETDFSVFDITERNPNVLLEVGLAFGFGKEVILLNNPAYAEELKKSYPIDLSGILIVQYDATSDIKGKPDFRRKIDEVMKYLHPTEGADKIGEIREAIDRYCAFEKEIQSRMVIEQMEEIELSFNPNDWNWKISGYRLPLKFNVVYGLSDGWYPLIFEKENGGIYEGKKAAYGKSKKEFIGLIGNAKAIDALIQDITICFERRRKE
jgi:hypothetical protein